MGLSPAISRDSGPWAYRSHPPGVEAWSQRGVSCDNWLGQQMQQSGGLASSRPLQTSSKIFFSLSPFRRWCHTPPRSTLLWHRLWLSLFLPFPLSPSLSPSPTTTLLLTANSHWRPPLCLARPVTQQGMEVLYCTTSTGCSVFSRHCLMVLDLGTLYKCGPARPHPVLCTTVVVAAARRRPFVMAAKLAPIYILPLSPQLRDPPLPFRQQRTNNQRQWQWHGTNQEVP